MRAFVGLSLVGLTLVPALVSLGCNSENAKGATAALVGTAVEVSKGTATGIVEGVIEGRKAGESADGAAIVTTWAELEKVGSVAVFDVKGEGDTANVVLAVENKGEVPLRISNMKVLGLDGDGFVVKPTSAGTASLTVPPKSKVRHKSTFAVAVKNLKSVRVFNHDLPATKP